MKKLLPLYVFVVTALVACNSSEPSQQIVGKIEKEETAIVAKVGGRLQKILVAEGDYVRQGDTLAILDIPELSAKKQQASGALTSAAAQYDMSKNGATANQLVQLKAKKQALQEQYNFAKKSAERLENLLRDSLIPVQQYDEVYAKMQGAHAQLVAVDAEINDVQNGVRMEQQQMALGQQQRAAGALHEVVIAEGEQYIIAPQDMMITTITLHQGELAIPGYTLFKGELPLSVSFRFSMPEKGIKNYVVQQKVRIEIRYNNQVINGKVKAIKPIGAYANLTNPYPDFDVQEVMYDVIIVPDDVEAAKEYINKSTVILL
jgi:HlyD family secretion protein